MEQSTIQDSLLKQWIETIIHQQTDDLVSLINKSIAITSGKGGVGKTTTAVNLALWCAKRGFKTALVDFDPLSDILSLLDLQQQKLEEHKDAVYQVFKNLFLLFPGNLKKYGELKEILREIYEVNSAQYAKDYDIIIFDLPAGINYEDNLCLLPFIKKVLVVTNPEPTAHVAAGYYLKAATNLYPEKEYLLWHNRFTQKHQSHFNPKDVIGNYNNNVLSEDQINGGSDKIRTFATIPEDPSLDLLQGNPDFHANIESRLSEIVQLTENIIIKKTCELLPYKSGMIDVISQFISANPVSEYEPEILIQELGEYLKCILPIPASAGALDLFTAEQRKTLIELVGEIKNHPTLSNLRRLGRLLKQQNDLTLQTKSLFSNSGNTNYRSSIIKEMTKVLIDLNNMARQNREIQPVGTMLLFNFSLYKLMDSTTIRNLILRLIPKKNDTRSRHDQIRLLIEKNRQYQEIYYKLIKTLFPIFNKQISSIGKTFNLNQLVFTKTTGEINKQAYAKLFSTFIHDSLFSGLGIVIGFDYRPASAAFNKIGEKLLNELNKI